MPSIVNNTMTGTDRASVWECMQFLRSKRPELRASFPISVVFGCGGSILRFGDDLYVEPIRSHTEQLRMRRWWDNEAKPNQLFLPVGDYCRGRITAVQFSSSSASLSFRASEYDEYDSDTYRLEVYKRNQRMHGGIIRSIRIHNVPTPVPAPEPAPEPVREPNAVNVSRYGDTTRYADTSRYANSWGEHPAFMLEEESQAIFSRDAIRQARERTNEDIRQSARQARQRRERREYETERQNARREEESAARQGLCFAACHDSAEAMCESFQALSRTMRTMRTNV
jgi:hypothetical protein